MPWLLAALQTAGTAVGSAAGAVGGGLESAATAAAPGLFGGGAGGAGAGGALSGLSGADLGAMAHAGVGLEAPGVLGGTVNLSPSMLAGAQGGGGLAALLPQAAQGPARMFGQLEAARGHGGGGLLSGSSMPQSNPFQSGLRGIAPNLSNMLGGGSGGGMGGMGQSPDQPGILQGGFGANGLLGAPGGKKAPIPGEPLPPSHPQGLLSTVLGGI